MPRRNGLSGFEDYQEQQQTAGQVPGIASGGGVDNRKPGLRGEDAAKFAGKWGEALDGIDRTKCGPLATPDCLELQSRMIEKTFHNFQLTARPPSHLAPPFMSQRIHVFGTVAVNAVFPVYVAVASFLTPPDSRGVIAELGFSLPAAALFPNVSIRLAKGGTAPANATPINPYQDIRQDLWGNAPAGRLCVPIQLRGNERFWLLASIVAPVVPPVNLTFQLCGWTYQVRAETGDTIKSTLVD
jgi:hypothetical protein